MNARASVVEAQGNDGEANSVANCGVWKEWNEADTHALRRREKRRESELESGDSRWDLLLPTNISVSSIPASGGWREFKSR